MFHVRTQWYAVYHTSDPLVPYALFRSDTNARKWILTRMEPSQYTIQLITFDAP